MFILIPLHRFFGRSDLQYIINYIKIGQVSFQFSKNYSNQIWAKFKERGNGTLTYHRIPHPSGHFLLYTLTILTAFHPKKDGVSTLSRHLW